MHVSCYQHERKPTEVSSHESGSRVTHAINLSHREEQHFTSGRRLKPKGNLVPNLVMEVSSLSVTVLVTSDGPGSLSAERGDG